jgi:NTP pyrophosphatase (non-canonical NTP hydrolase)
MISKDLTEFISAESQRLNSNYYADYDGEKRVFSATVKMVEEVGELCDAVLKSHKVQRAEKMEGFDKSKLEHEIADVIITTLLIAELMDVDVNEALRTKIKKIESRYDNKGMEKS